MTHLLATDIISAGNITSAQALQLVRKGQQLRCPRCASILKTVPENWKSGMPLSGIECPTDQWHFMIHCDDAKLVKEMRARMKARANKN